MSKPKPKRSVPIGWPSDWPIPDVEDRNEAAAYLHAEATRIIHSQKALLAGGYITEPNPDQLRRAVSFHNVARFMELCAPHRQKVLDLLKRLREQDR
ncbi:MAG: hypothetical protein DI527_00395 [Chelatococcus sp.]|nr:MAG: hypothetical protein DI527_00395 [Chelatococcus sp.]